MRDALENIELTEAVQGLRDQLISCVESSAGQQIKFEVEEIDLEFVVELRRDVNAKAGFRAWVTSVDLQGGAARNSTHRVSIKLRPKESGSGNPLEIGNQSKVDMGEFTALPGESRT
jgi:hypothetical protein